MELIAPDAEDYKRLREVGVPLWEWWKKDVGEEWGQKAIDLALGKV